MTIPALILISPVALPLLAVLLHNGWWAVTEREWALAACTWALALILTCLYLVAAMAAVGA